MRPGRPACLRPSEILSRRKGRDQLARPRGGSAPHGCLIIRGHRWSYRGGAPKCLGKDARAGATWADRLRRARVRVWRCNAGRRARVGRGRAMSRARGGRGQVPGSSRRYSGVGRRFWIQRFASVRCCAGGTLCRSRRPRGLRRRGREVWNRLGRRVRRRIHAHRLSEVPAQPGVHVAAATAARFLRSSGGRSRGGSQRQTDAVAFAPRATGSPRVLTRAGRAANVSAVRADGQAAPDHRPLPH